MCKSGKERALVVKLLMLAKSKVRAGKTREGSMCKAVSKKFSKHLERADVIKCSATCKKCTQHPLRSCRLPTGCPQAYLRSTLVMHQQSRVEGGYQHQSWCCMCKAVNSNASAKQSLEDQLPSALVLHMQSSLESERNCGTRKSQNQASNDLRQF